MIGSIVLSLALASSVIAMVMYFLSFKGYKNTLNIGRIAYHTMAMLVIAASAILLYLILTHDYSYKYIYNYSSNDLTHRNISGNFLGGSGRQFYAVGSAHIHCGNSASKLFIQSAVILSQELCLCSHCQLRFC